MPQLFFWLDRPVTPDSAVIYQNSHELVLLRSGLPLGDEIAGPMRFILGEDARDAALPTLFTAPGLVARRAFLADLERLAIDNLQVYPALIDDPVDGREIDQYVFINVLGAVPCADLKRSRGRQVGPRQVLIEEPVLRAAKLPALELFRLAEDSRFLIASERVARALGARGYRDLKFRELAQS